MRMVHDVLKDCGYGMKETFCFTYRWNDTEYRQQACPFVSEQYPDDVYLLVSLQPAELAHTLDNSFMSALAISFRKQVFHRSAMDRNTTLFLSCLHNAGEQIDHNLRVRLEDDPYYFKKYVFAYTLEDEAAAVQYVEENRRDEGTLIETIRGCLLNTALFAACSSVALLKGYPMTVGRFLTLLYLSRFLVLLAPMHLCIFISERSGGFEKTFLISGLLLAIPAAAVLLGVDAVAWTTPMTLLSYGNFLFSSVSGAVQFVIWMGISVAALLLARHYWCRPV